jgi:murein DD-endopeptidase MepM/ murein hydrolase activator NlpD
MGNYNSEYEDYYNSLKKRSNIRNYAYSGNYNMGKSAKAKSNYFIRRVTKELIGVLILFIFVIVCRVISNSQTRNAYNYSKKVINQNYNYEELKEKSKDINLNKVQSRITNIIEQIGSKITGQETVQEKIKSKFILLVRGTEIVTYGCRENAATKTEKSHSGIEITVKKNTDVRASYDGRIQSCGEDGQIGKYIVIDHGDGIETKYGYLGEILVKKEDEVKKNQVIAKSRNIDKSNGTHLYFELLYMGENEDPNEYFNIIKK